MNARISINPLICHGKPVIRNTRVLVSNILSDLAIGEPYSEIIENYPNITEEDIKAALQFGSELANFESFTYEVVEK
jgi:uncharacterized protein (DUF433 family)